MWTQISKKRLLAWVIVITFNNSSKNKVQIITQDNNKIKFRIRLLHKFKQMSVGKS